MPADDDIIQRYLEARAARGEPPGAGRLTATLQRGRPRPRRRAVLTWIWPGAVVTAAALVIIVSAPRGAPPSRSTHDGVGAATAAPTGTPLPSARSSSPLAPSAGPPAAPALTPGTTVDPLALPALPQRPVGSDNVLGILGRVVLSGSEELDGGCLWVEDEGKRIAVVWPSGYSAKRDPLRLFDHHGRLVAVAGERIQVSGSATKDWPMERCQVSSTVWHLGAVMTPRNTDPEDYWDYDLEAAIDARIYLGLRADEAFVRRLVERYGLPFSPEEEALLGRVSVVADRVHDYASAHRDTFGGVVVRPGTQPTVTALFTSDVETHRTALRAIVSDDARLDVRLVAHSEVELRRTVDVIGRDADELAGDGVEVRVVTLNVADNVVDVRVSGNAPERARQVLFGRYGDVPIRVLTG